MRNEGGNVILINLGVASRESLFATSVDATVTNVYFRGHIIMKSKNVALNWIKKSSYFNYVDYYHQEENATVVYLNKSPIHHVVSRYANACVEIISRHNIWLFAESAK